MSELDDRAVRGLRALVRGPGEGDVLDDRFELRGVIGEGAMGVVFAAWDRRASREVAVKVLTSLDEHAEARFAREGAALDGVAHPALVRCVARGVHDGTPYFAMDRLSGCTLAERLGQGPLRAGDTIALGRRVAGALEAVHRAGLAHRDVKPSNLFLERGDPCRAHLIDFGLARGEGAGPLTREGALVGTPGYMAPEQIRGDPSSGAPADVFALGCVLFECRTGRAAFHAETTEALFAQILVGAPWKPSEGELGSDAPAALDALIARMLEKKPRDRPTAADVARELGDMAALAPTESPLAEGDAMGPSLAEGVIVGGKYRVERAIGRGGMGVVYLARHMELGKRVALKLMRGGLGADQARFLREAQAASRLESEHVARVLDVGRMDGGAPYMVMEHLNGVDLARLLRERGALDARVAAGYVLQACDALAEAHALGIVHRDLKPSNLFVVTRRDGTELVKVLDFGISKLTRPLEGSTGDDAGLAATMTGASAVMGSVSYMSPEQLQSAANVDARSDIWSLGVVLYELVSGTRPFEGESAAAIGARIAAGAPKPLREVTEGAPPALEALISRCLKKDPEQRPRDVTELARALAKLAPDALPRSAAHATSRAPSRRRALGFAAAALVALVVAGGARSRRAEPTPDPSRVATATAPLPFPLPPASATATGVVAATAEPSVSAATATPAASPSPRAQPKRPPKPVPPSATAASTKTPPHDVDLSNPALGGR